nr:hypothetical protein [Mycolicibacterium sp. CBMA 213]
MAAAGLWFVQPAHQHYRGRLVAGRGLLPRSEIDDMTLWLDDKYISSKQKVSVLTAEPNTWLFIYSGLAGIQEQDEAGVFTGGHASNPTINIKLDSLAGELLEYASTSSLADISGSAVGQWATLSDSLALHDNGDLVLSTELRVFTGGGDYEVLGHYSYYVSAKVRLEAAWISGTVRWSKALAQPANPPFFTASAVTHLPPPPGSLAGITQTEATGTNGGLDSSDPNYYRVPYTITGALLGKTVSVEIDPIRTAFSGFAMGALIGAKQINGPDPIAIGNLNPQVTGVDFEITFGQAPR